MNKYYKFEIAARSGADAGRNGILRGAVLFHLGGRRSALQLFAAQRGKKTVEGGKTVRCQLEHARVGSVVPAAAPDRETL